MRITIVTGPFQPLPPAGCGAVERIWQNMAIYFATQNHKVTLLSRGHVTQKSDEALDGVRYMRRAQFVQTGRIAWDLAKDLAYTLRMLAILPPADILVTNTFWFPILAPLLSTCAGKVVVNVARVPKGQMRLYKRASRLSAVSNAICDQIVKECPSVASIVKVIPNPINIEIFTPPALPRNRASKQTILYTGRIHPEKGLALLIDAFADIYARLKSVRLRLIGPWRIDEGGGGQEYLNALEAKAYGLPVDFYEPIYDEKKLVRELQLAHVYCYPSLAEKGESFGVAPLEAMAAGLAPVVSDLPCFRDFLEDGITGYVFNHRVPKAVVYLSAALEKLLTNPKRAEQMGRKATERARDFSCENIARMYLKDFEEIIGSRN
jgi:glycosyltransferase involved in cell wall biosynthesis